MTISFQCFLLTTCLLVLTATTSVAQLPDTPGRHHISVTSSIDSSNQPSYLILPDNYFDDEELRPIVVSLHTWSYDLEQSFPELEQEVSKRGWIYLFPNFRGKNETFEACASGIARQDVIDALDWTLSNFRTDPSRVYLTGMSGGGFMTLAMVSSFPSRWTAASAWVPLSDLRAWYDVHAGDVYGEMTRGCIGGDPAENSEALAELDRRSPLYQMKHASGVALDISAGRFDGHLGKPIPVWHSIAAFNEIADSVGEARISALEIEQLSRHDPMLDDPGEGDIVTDPTFGREIFMRRHAGKARITIFDGGHDWLIAPILEWFEKHPQK